VPKYDCPIFPLELHQLKKLIDPIKVELNNIRNQFNLAKKFEISTSSREQK